LGSIPRQDRFAMSQYSTADADAIGQPGVNQVVQPDANRSLLLAFVVLGVGAIVITAAWILLFGYGAWLLLEWLVD
jgi:hypothetical protein